MLLLGQLLTEMGMREGLEVSWLPSYGPEMRSGSAHCHVCLSKERIGSPLVSHPDVLVAMNELSLRKFASQVARGRTHPLQRESLPAGLSAAASACHLHSGLGDGRQARLDQSRPTSSCWARCSKKPSACCRKPLKACWKTKVKKVELMEINRKAMAAGRDFIDHYVRVGAVTQPDGFAY